VAAVGQSTTRNAVTERLKLRRGEIGLLSFASEPVAQSRAVMQILDI
jgi:hypothetical protein